MELWSLIQAAVRAPRLEISHEGALVEGLSNAADDAYELLAPIAEAPVSVTDWEPEADVAAAAGGAR